MTHPNALPPISTAYLESIPNDFSPLAASEFERWLLRSIRRLSDEQRRQFLAHLKMITAEVRHA